jgi:hypothetical protein
MPLELIDLDGGIGNMVVARGRVTEQEYVDFYTRQLTQDEEEFGKYRYSLSDYTAVSDIEVSAGAVQEIMQLARASAAANPDAIFAIVVGQDVLYGLSRMSEILLDGSGWETWVFRSRVEAEEWIRRRVEEKFGITNLTLEPT